METSDPRVQFERYRDLLERVVRARGGDSAAIAGQYTWPGAVEGAPALAAQEPAQAGIGLEDDIRLTAAEASTAPASEGGNDTWSVSATTGDALAVDGPTAQQPVPDPITGPEQMAASAAAAAAQTADEPWTVATVGPGPSPIPPEAPLSGAAPSLPPTVAAPRPAAPVMHPPVAAPPAAPPPTVTPPTAAPPRVVPPVASPPVAAPPPSVPHTQAPPAAAPAPPPALARAAAPAAAPVARPPAAPATLPPASAPVSAPSAVAAAPAHTTAPAAAPRPPAPAQSLPAPPPTPQPLTGAVPTGSGGSSGEGAQ